MIKFINETDSIHEKFTAVKSIEMTLGEEPSLVEMLEAFEQFLRASGYSFVGELEIVDNSDLYKAVDTEP